VQETKKSYPAAPTFRGDAKVAACGLDSPDQEPQGWDTVSSTFGDIRSSGSLGEQNKMPLLSRSGSAMVRPAALRQRRGGRPVN
jgi:hypothetical protein